MSSRKPKKKTHRAPVGKCIPISLIQERLRFLDGIEGIHGTKATLSVGAVRKMFTSLVPQ